MGFITSSRGCPYKCTYCSQRMLTGTTYRYKSALRIVEGNFEATFTAELMLKDVALAARMAGASLAHMPILRETLAAYGETGAKGWGGQDFSAVTHVVEQRFSRTISGA